ncbi:MAG: sugar ABC transporter substrate-binding protein [Phycisphaerae bacterium]|nr:sugar ABC transporter substrate-binding protein [Phycisphaerae bacterium]
MRVFVVATLFSAVVLLAILSRAVVGRAAGSARIVLRVSNWGSPAVESGFMTLEREIREEFEQMHPGVRVQFEQIPGFGQYAPKLLMMHVSGSVPDVIALDASSAAVFIDNGVVRDLAPLVAEDPEFRLADYFERVVQIFRRDQRVYSIPLDFTPMMMYYNRRLFDAAGVPYPQRGWTWDEFLHAAQRLTIPADQPGAPPRQYGMYFMNVMPFWVPWLWTNGGDVLDPTGRQATGNFDGPRSVAAMQFLTDLMLTHHVAPTIDEGKAAGVDLFRSGRAAMDVKGHWMMIDYQAEGLDFGVVDLPTNTGQPTTVIYASGLSIMTKSPHADLAWEYIKYMTSREVQVRRVSSGLAISGNRQAAAHYAGTPVEDAFIAAVEYARAPWGATVERYPVVEALGEEMMEDLLRSRAALGVQTELHRAAQLIDAALAEP